MEPRELAGGDAQQRLGAEEDRSQVERSLAARRDLVEARARDLVAGAQEESPPEAAGSPRASAELREARRVPVGPEERDAAVRLAESLEPLEAGDPVREHRGGGVELERLEVDEPALVEGRRVPEIAVRDEHPARRLVRESALAGLRLRRLSRR